MKSILAFFATIASHLTPANPELFCAEYRSYTDLLTPDLRGAYVIINNRQAIRELTPGELYDLSQLRKHMNDAKVTCK